MTMADRLAVMSDGQIVQLGTPAEVYESPNCRFTAEFIGSTNLFHGRVMHDPFDAVMVQCAELPVPLHIDRGIAGLPGMEVWVSIRPERMQLSDRQPEMRCNWGRGRVGNAAYMGSYTLYQVVLDSGQTLLANLSGPHLAGQARTPVQGDTVFVSWTADSGVVLTR